LRSAALCRGFWLPDRLPPATAGRGRGPATRCERGKDSLALAGTRNADSERVVSWLVSHGRTARSTSSGRAFRDGHAETWWAADATLGWSGPDGARRLVAATADPATLPGKATWYLVTNLPRPGGPRKAGSPHPAAERGPARRWATASAVLATGITRGTRLAFPLDRATALVAGMVQGAPAAAAASPDQLGHRRPRPAPLHPGLTNYR
jgi:hypothetical protein